MATFLSNLRSSMISGQILHVVYISDCPRLTFGKWVIFDGFFKFKSEGFQSRWFLNLKVRDFTVAEYSK